MGDMNSIITILGFFLTLKACCTLKTNVLFFILDDFKAALGSYGDLNAYTPNIDRLVSKSFVFTKAYAQQALCAPSRNSFLTSRRPDTLHLYDFYSYWRESVGNFTTLPQYFKERGYHTHSVGKVFHPGISSNFSDDEPYSWSQKPFHPKTIAFKNAKVCTNLDGTLSKNLICPVRTEFQPYGTLPDIESKEEAVNFLKYRNKSQNNPYFLAIGFHKPHIPFKFPESYLDLHPLNNISLPKNRVRPSLLPDVAWNPWTDIRERDDIKKLNISFPYGAISDDVLKKITQAYYASVSYVDDLIGNVLKYVDMKDTIVMLTGDHDGDKAKCDLCKQTFSYKTSTSNLKRHMQRKHTGVSLEKVVEHVQENDHIEEIGNKVQDDPKPGSSTEQDLKDVPGTSNILSSTTTALLRVRSSQQSIRTFIPKKITTSAKKKLDEALMDMFVLDFQPFSIVEDKGFKKFMKELHPGYILPKRKTISQTYIPALYENCLAETKNLAQNIRKICITTDCWTSRNNESYMAVTGHFIDSNFTQHSILLDCSVFPERHTSVNLAAELRRVTTDWVLEGKILIAVSDNAANIKNAISEQLRWRHFGCFAHTINLIVMSGLKNEEIETVILNVKAIVTHFKRSSSAQDKLMTYQKNNGATQPKKMIQDVVTRWNSTFYMIERFLEQEDAIKVTVAILDAPLKTLAAEEWSLLRELCIILRPFEDVTKAVSGEKYMSASLVIVLTSGLKNVCSKLGRTTLSEPAELVLTTLQIEIDTRLGKIEESNTLAVCTFLDPRFKNLAFQDPKTADIIKKLVIGLVSEYISETDLKNVSGLEDNAGNVIRETENFSSASNENNFSVWDIFDTVAATHKPQGTASSKAIIEVQRYLEDDLLPRDKDPLEWWYAHSYNYPNKKLSFKKDIVLSVHQCHARGVSPMPEFF